MCDYADNCLSLLSLSLSLYTYMCMCCISRISSSWARAGCKKTLCLLHYPRKIKFIHSFIHSISLFLFARELDVKEDVLTSLPSLIKEIRSFVLSLSQKEINYLHRIAVNLIFLDTTLTTDQKLK